MDNSTRIMVCMFCMCLSVPLFGMQRIKRWVGVYRSHRVNVPTIEDQLNQAAVSFSQKVKKAHLWRKNSYEAPVAAVMFGLVAVCSTNFAICRLEEEKRVNMYVAADVVAAAIGGSFGYMFGSYADNEDLDQMLIKIEKKCLEGMPDILKADIDESKLTDEAKALLVAVRKRAAAKKD